MLKIIKDYFRRHFGFNRSEIRGIIVLTPILILMLFVPHHLKKYLQSQPPIENVDDVKKLKEWYNQSISRQHPDSLTFKGLTTRYFDPNKISKQQWLALGFKSQVVDRIIKYRQAGGKFYEKNDLLKIYGISKRLVYAHQEYIHIEAKKPKPQKNWLVETKKENKITGAQSYEKLKDDQVVKIKAALNLADTASLKKIYGIGPKLSMRIVKFRDALGGFYDPQQLKEVYGLKPEVIVRLFEDFELTGRHLRQIDINQISIDSLVKHPYFNYQLSNVIVNYRNQHGHFNFKTDLKQIKILNDSIYARIAPYLKIVKYD